MKNDQLDELTKLAKALTDEDQYLLLDGDGHFVSGSSRQRVPASDVLRMLTQYQRKAAELYGRLGALPRRKVATK